MGGVFLGEAKIHPGDNSPAWLTNSAKFVPGKEEVKEEDDHPGSFRQMLPS